MRYILSIMAENNHGALAKIIQVITARGYNIHTITGGPSETAEISRVIITFNADEKFINQIVKQLNKLIDVIKVFLIDDNERVERELVLLRVVRKKEREASLCRIVDIFKGKIVHVSSKNFVIELTGSSKKINAFIENVKPFGLQDLMRTGPLALSRFQYTKNDEIIK